MTFQIFVGMVFGAFFIVTFWAFEDFYRFFVEKNKKLAISNAIAFLIAHCIATAVCAYIWGLSAVFYVFAICIVLFIDFYLRYHRVKKDK